MRSVLKAQKRFYTTSLFSKAPSRLFSTFEGEQADVSTVTSKKSSSINKVLQAFENNNANFSQLESQSRSLKNEFVSFEFEQASRTIQEIRHFNEEIGTPIVPWFPTKLSELDNMGGNLIETDEVAGKDHPQFTDREYRKRRDQIAENSKNTKIADPLPILEYLPSELGTWKTIFQKIIPIHERLMCKQYLECFAKLQKHCGLNENNIPQLRTLNEYLQSETQFRVKPVHGILSQREFLNALAFRTFCCTQYIRHHEFPFYTPEPDVVHEIIGHVPMFADKSFCDMSQMIGLLSLGASEEDLAKLASIYWYTVEFGVCKEGDALKVFGAGIAPCVAELEHFMSDKARFEDLDPVNLRYDYPLQDVQPVYMVAKSFDHAKAQLIEFGDHINRPFKAYYDLDKQEIKTDRKIRMRKADEASKLF